MKKLFTIIANVFTPVKIENMKAFTILPSNI